MILRPYQVEAHQAILAELRAHRSTLLEMATGTGKTAVLASIAARGARVGRRVLVLAHRDHLLEQAKATLERWGVSRVVLEQGPNRAAVGDRVVVASVQTLKGARLDAWPRDWFHLVIVDEAHRAAAKGYRAILDHFAAAKVLGVTATPWRLDGQALGDVFDSVAYRYPIERGIRDGYLVPIHSHRVVVEGLQLGEVRKRAGDFAAGELSKLLADEGHLHGVVAPLLERAGSRPTVVFAVDVAHGQALVDMLNRYRPICAALVTGKRKDNTNGRARADIFADHAAGEFQFLVNCQVLTEGWDAPYVSCVAIARPTMSWSLFAQMIGRGTRLHPGKQDCLVLDFVGNAGKHTLIGPEDVLAGRVLDAETRAAVQGLAAENPELAALDLLEMAQDWLAGEQERKSEQAALTAVATFYTEVVDLFVGHVKRDTSDEPAHDYQRRALGWAGLEAPEGLSAGDAAQLLLALQERKEQGKATPKQVRWLISQRMPPAQARALSKEQASEIMGTMIGRFSTRKAR